uniref:Uncharacterized protein n=1 Tax=Glossina pallidipes TaxID=7398 RepID=A0A1A9Z6A2_GLOPL
MKLLAERLSCRHKLTEGLKSTFENSSQIISNYVVEIIFKNHFTQQHPLSNICANNNDNNNNDNSSLKHNTTILANIQKS